MASLFAIGVAAIFTCVAVSLAFWHIYMHLINYTEPTYQRYTVRLVFMVPVYAMMSFLSLLMRDKSIYFNSLRDIYEAFVIYNFLSLCLAWVGGPGAVVQSLHGRLLKPSIELMTCCLPAIPLDGRFIRRCKQGVLQFVILKPPLVVATFIFYAKHKYEEGNFSVTQGYLYITIVYTISYSLALYVLILFYVACSDLLKPFKPLPKFVVVKSVVFLTYWQSVFISLAAKMGILKAPEDIQDFLICLEMSLAAIGHIYAFPYKEYAEANIGGSSGLLGSVAHALNFHDVVSDTVHQFAPTYHDYVLYSNGGDEAPKKYRVRTFVPVGKEMGTLHRHNKMFGAGKVDETYAAGLSSLDARKLDDSGHAKGGKNDRDSLLYDSSLTSLQSYDMSPLDISKQHKGTAFESRFRSDSQCSNASRRDSSEDDVLETSFLAPNRRKSSHGIMMDEIDIHEEYEGFVQR